MTEDWKGLGAWTLGAAAAAALALGNLCAGSAWGAESAEGAPTTKAVEVQKAPAKKAASAKASVKVPAQLERAAKRWKVNLNDVVISVLPLEGVSIDRKTGRSNAASIKGVLSLNAERSHSPASTAKLVTTLVALEELGPNFHWFTGFYTKSWPDAKGHLKGGLYIRGGGDPTLVVEDFALQLDKLAQLGVKHIDGNIVLDRSYFSIPKTDPGAFDGRRSRPYNLPPDAALVNFRNLSLELIPDRAAGIARVVALPPLAGVAYPKTVKLSKGSCGDWKTKLGFKLRTNKDGTKRAVFNGSLPRACGAKIFNVIAFEADEYFERLFRSLWEKDGRTWKGKVVAGRIPADADRRFVRMSPSLAETAVLTNKWSNNTMARHIFLSLGRVKVQAEEKAAATAEKTAAKATAKAAAGKAAQQKSKADAAAKAAEEKPQWREFSRGVTLDDARDVVADWLEKRGINPKAIHLDNGSGLSRETRVTGRAMTEILAAGWQGPAWPEYAASLPITGEDGTMIRRKVAVGYGRIKTGFLADVRSIGGYVLAQNGKRYAVYASVHGAKNMPGGIAFLNSVIDWVWKLD